MAERLSVDPPLRKGMHNQSGESSMTGVNHVDEVEDQTEAAVVEARLEIRFVVFAVAALIM